MSRLDPQDAGAGNRNMIGLPGGMDSPLMRVIEEENVNGMKLLRGEGNRAGERGKPTEDDVFNAVWIYDSNDLPFYAAEVYHQFHDGLGYRFPEEYTVELKKKAMKRGLVGDGVPGDARETSWCVSSRRSRRDEDSGVEAREKPLKKRDETRSKPVEPNGRA